MLATSTVAVINPRHGSIIPFILGCRQFQARLHSLGAPSCQYHNQLLCLLPLPVFLLYRERQQLCCKESSSSSLNSRKLGGASSTAAGCGTGRTRLRPRPFYCCILWPPPYCRRWCTAKELCSTRSCCCCACCPSQRSASSTATVANGPIAAAAGSIASALGCTAPG